MFHQRFTWLIILFMAGTPSLVAAQQPTYVTDDAAFGAVVQIKRILTAPEMEMLPVEIFSAAGKQEIGIDPVDVTSLTLMVEASNGPPDVGVVVRFEKPIALKDLKTARMQLEEGELNGRLYLRSTRPPAPGLYMPDEKTLLVGSDEMIGKMLVQGRREALGPLAKKLTVDGGNPDFIAAAVLAPVRELLDGQLQQAPLPPPFDELKRIPKLLDSASVTLNVIKDIGGQLELHSPTEAAAKELHMITTDLLEVGLQMTLAQLASQMPAGDDPIEVATRRYSERMTRLIFFKLRPKLDGDKLVMNYTNDASGQIAAMGTVVALLLPAVQAAREAARRASSANNLKQIALAMHNYHDAYRRFPAAASLDEDGKPLLSWRVHILPYVGENALYKEFHLDEPWNSKHNIKLLERMPLIYKNPSSQLQGPMSNYLLPTGKGSIFEDPKKEVGLRDITDGSSNTILALEVNDEKAVKWTQPGDLAYDMDDPLVGLGNAHPGGFMAAFGDGSVRFIAQTIDEELFGFLLGMADGQRTDF